MKASLAHPQDSTPRERVRSVASLTERHKRDPGNPLFRPAAHAKSGEMSLARKADIPVHSAGLLAGDNGNTSRQECQRDAFREKRPTIWIACERSLPKN
jgi:hypothetical protein